MVAKDNITNGDAEMPAILCKGLKFSANSDTSINIIENFGSDKNVEMSNLFEIRKIYNIYLVTEDV